MVKYIYIYILKRLRQKEIRDNKYNQLFFTEIATMITKAIKRDKRSRPKQ